MSKFYKHERASLTNRPESDRDEIFFDGWAINIEESVCYVTYISSEHGGGEKKFIISKQDYGKAKVGKKGLLDLIAKYNKFGE